MLTSPYCASSLVTALSRVTKGIAQGRERGGVDSPVQIYTMAISENVVFFLAWPEGTTGGMKFREIRGVGFIWTCAQFGPCAVI